MEKDSFQLSVEEYEILFCELMNCFHDKPYRLRCSLVESLMCILSASLAVSILEAVLTVSPNKQYLGTFQPTTPGELRCVYKHILNINANV